MQAHGKDRQGLAATRQIIQTAGRIGSRLTSSKLHFATFIPSQTETSAHSRLLAFLINSNLFLFCFVLFVCFS